MIERDREHGVAGEHQPVASGLQADHAVSRCVAAGASDDNPRRYLVLHLERPQLAVVLVQELLGCPPRNVHEIRRHTGAGEIRRPPERDLGGRNVDPQVRTQPVLHPVDEQPANVVHVHVGKYDVGHGCEIDAGGLQSMDQMTSPTEIRNLQPQPTSKASPSGGRITGSKAAIDTN